MAPLDDLMTALQASEAQKQQIAASNPYTPAANIFGQLGTTIATSGPQYSMRDKLIYGALSGLFSGALTGMAQRRDNNAQAAYTDVIRRSLGGETNIQQPDELPAGLFQSAQEAGQTALFKRQLAQQIADQEFERDLQKTATAATIAEAVKNPRMAPQIIQAGKSGLANLLGKEPPAVRIQGTGTAPLTVAGQAQEAVSPTPATNIPGVDPRTQKLLAQRDEILAQTGSQEVADKFFEAQIKRGGEEESNFDKFLQENQTKINQNQEVLGELSSALTQAGETGTRYFGGEMFRPLTLGVKSLVSDDAKQALAARSVIKSEALKAAGKLAAEFKGSTTDREMQLYLGATIGLDKLPEQNAALFERMQRAQGLLQQKQDFLSTARQQGLSLPQAERAYSEFDKNFPLFVNDDAGNRVLNPLREQIDPKQVDLSNIPALARTMQEQQGREVATQQPEISQQAPQQEEQQGGGILQGIDDTAMGVLNAGARFGNTALFGIPKRAVAAGETAINELGDLFGVGAGRTIGENYDRSMGAINDTMAFQKQQNPITSMGADIAGAVASPVNKLQAVQALTKAGQGAKFLSGANAAGMAGRAALGGTQLAMTNDDPNTSTGEALATGALGSVGVDTLARGAKALAPAAKDVFRKLLGVTSTDIREAAKGVSKVDMGKAVQKFDDAIDIVNKEHGLSGLQLAKGDETVLQDVIRKAQDSIVSRNNLVDEVIGYGDYLLKQDKTGVNVPLNQLNALAKANELTNGEQLKQEGIKIYNTFMQKYGIKGGKGALLSDLQRAKKELNTMYIPGEQYNDVYTALATDFRNAIENQINKFVDSKQLVGFGKDVIKNINKEEGSLIQLRNSLAKKLPGALAADVMSDFRSKFFTTGTTGMFGMGQFGEALAGDAGKGAGYAAALLGASKRVMRPIAEAVGSGRVAENLIQPGTRSGLLAAQQALTPNMEQPNFDVQDFAPRGGAANFQLPSEVMNMAPTTEPPAPQVEQATQEPEAQPIAMDQSVDPFRGLQPELVKAVVWQESRGKSDAVSPKGATGLMQIMPATAKEIAAELGYKEGEYDLKDPKISKEFGTHYLKKMMRQFDDEGLALAAYNAGPGQVDKWVKKYGNTWDKVSAGIKRDILDGKLSRRYFEETMKYVPSILRKRDKLVEA